MESLVGYRESAAGPSVPAAAMLAATYGWMLCLLRKYGEYGTVCMYRVRNVGAALTDAGS